jgi:hypothetical protein
VTKPGEANHRAAARANLNEPRNTNSRTASVSDCMKPALMWETTDSPHEVLRGQRGQRDGTELLGTWENPRGAGGVSHMQRVGWRINKPCDCRWGVGEVHSSDEAGESPWSEGALAVGKQPQKRKELIGR